MDSSERRAATGEGVGRSGRRRRQNVFADLGLPNPEQELLKAQLTLQIYKIVKARGLTQAQAGAVLASSSRRLGADAQSRWQFLGRAAVEFLTALGQDVRITVKPTKKRVGEMDVVVG